MKDLVDQDLDDKGAEQVPGLFPLGVVHVELFEEGFEVVVFRLGKLDDGVNEVGLFTLLDVEVEV